MTTFNEEKEQCSVCGAENEYSEIRSTNRYGLADLDTRPPEMMRSTIFAWVRRCQGCGYCASELSETCQEAEAVVNSKEYKDQLNDPIYPELANSFLCKAIVDQESGHFAAATWAFIRAAWACDDSDYFHQAVACRQKAVDMLLISEENGQQVAAQEGVSTTIIVDLLRRSRKIDQARNVIAVQRGGISDDIIARTLDFQTALLDRPDVSCHTIAEALREVRPIADRPSNTTERMDHQALINGPVISKPSSIFLKLKGLFGRD